MAFGLSKKTKSEPSLAPIEESQGQKSPKRSGGKRKAQTLLSSVINESAVGAAIDVLKQNEAFALPNGTSWVGLLLNADDIDGLSQKQKNDATKGSIIELIAADKIQVVATKVMLDNEWFGIVPTTETLDRVSEYSLLTGAKYHWVLFRAEDAGNTLLADAIENVEASYGRALEIASGQTTLAAVLPQVWEWGGGSAPSSAAGDREFNDILVGAKAGAGAADADPLGGAFNLTDTSATPSLPSADEPIDYAVLEAGGALSIATGEVTDDEPLSFNVEQFERDFAIPTSPVLPTSPPAPADSGPSFTFDDEIDATAATDVANGDDQDADEGEGYFQYLEANKDRVVDEDEVRETILRRFMSGDLDLVVDTEEFDKVFATDAPAIALEIADDPSDWLGSQVAQLSRQANAAIAQLHQGNVDELRELFSETMALHIERTQAAVSTDLPDSQYYALFEGAKRDFEERRAASPQELAARREEIRSEFRAAADARAEAAAAHARSTYEDRNRPKLERDLAEAGLELDRRNEEQYAHDRQTVLVMRQRDAALRMDVGTNRIFELLRERQAEQREAERALLEHWSGVLVQFIDENRKANIDRSMVLADQLARTNAVETLRNEHAAELAAARQEASGREERLTTELARIRREALEELESRRASWEASLRIAEEGRQAQSALVDQLRTQMQEQGTSYENKYQARISELVRDKESYKEELDRAHQIQKRATYLLVGLAIVIAIAGVLVGVTIGVSWGHDQVNDTAAAHLGLTSVGALRL